jgi:hypothetical protein
MLKRWKRGAGSAEQGAEEAEHLKLTNLKLTGSQAESLLRCR